jgi:hypothetical protein
MTDDKGGGGWAGGSGARSVEGRHVRRFRMGPMRPMRLMCGIFPDGNGQPQTANCHRNQRWAVPVS